MIAICIEREQRQAETVLAWNSVARTVITGGR
jgi:hypothetical protein